MCFKTNNTVIPLEPHKGVIIFFFSLNSIIHNIISILLVYWGIFTKLKYLLKNTTSENDLKERMHEAIHRKKVGKAIFTADSVTWQEKIYISVKDFQLLRDYFIMVYWQYIQVNMGSLTLLMAVMEFYFIKKSMQILLWTWRFFS